MELKPIRKEPIFEATIRNSGKKSVLEITVPSDFYKEWGLKLGDLIKVRVLEVQREEENAIIRILSDNLDISCQITD